MENRKDKSLKSPGTEDVGLAWILGCFNGYVMITRLLDEEWSLHDSWDTGDQQYRRPCYKPLEKGRTKHLPEYWMHLPEPPRE